MTVPGAANCREGIESGLCTSMVRTPRVACGWGPTTCYDTSVAVRRLADTELSCQSACKGRLPDLIHQLPGTNRRQERFPMCSAPGKTGAISASPTQVKP